MTIGADGAETFADGDEATPDIWDAYQNNPGLARLLASISYDVGFGLLDLVGRIGTCLHGRSHEDGTLHVAVRFGSLARSVAGAAGASPPGPKRLAP